MDDSAPTQGRKRKLPGFLQAKSATELPAANKAAGASRKKSKATESLQTASPPSSPVKQVQTKLKLQRKPKSAVSSGKQLPESHVLEESRPAAQRRTNAKRRSCIFLVTHF